jgi:uncharacterized membrane protein YobD (UPF0266 family)
MTVCTLIYMNLIELLLYNTHTSLDSLITSFINGS